ncbi:xylan 1,4-beta-xylosidase [Aureococcus anophagefferens]|uniref:Xylan 1,4-beta-xylosidase n=1 Tax=Aureococcus anophagefferens TaxID=44056 RepID=A0ABR1FJX9_AURAN
MVPFQACVEKGKVSSLMCSYNAVNGVRVARRLAPPGRSRAWHFDGYITSDCDADSNVYDAHHYAATPEEAVADVLKAGTDVRLRLGHFDLSFDAAACAARFDEIDADAVVCSDAHLDASMEGLAQSATLLKNDGALPLKPSGTAAVVGPNALLSKADAGYYGPTDVCGGDYWTLLDAVADGGAVAASAVLGVPTVLSGNLELIDAVATASATPVVVVVFSAAPPT